MLAPQLEVFPGDIIFGDEDGIVRVDPAIAAEVLVAANEIRQMENGIFAGTLTPSMAMLRALCLCLVSGCV